jgi:hypothetical protein
MNSGAMEGLQSECGKSGFTFQNCLELLQASFQWIQGSSKWEGGGNIMYAMHDRECPQEMLRILGGI